MTSLSEQVVTVATLGVATLGERARRAHWAAQVVQENEERIRKERARASERQQLEAMLRNQFNVSGVDAAAEWTPLADEDGEVWEHAVIEVDDLRFALHYSHGGVCYAGLVTECPKCHLLFTRAVDGIVDLGRLLDEPVVHFRCSADRKQASDAPPVPIPPRLEEVLLGGLKELIRQELVFMEEGR